MRLVATVAVSVVAAGVVGVVSEPATAGGDNVTIRVAKNPDGPYETEFQGVNLPVGKTKNFYFRVANKTDGQLSPTVQANFDGQSEYVVKWFKGKSGNTNITTEIENPNSLQPSIPAGGKRFYRARVKHILDPNEGYCIEFHTNGPVDEQTIVVGIETSCAF